MRCVYKIFEGFPYQADLMLTVVLSLLGVVVTRVPSASLTPARIAVGLLVVLFLPGYSLVAALFPRRDDMRGVVRLALSLGTSIAVVPLLCFPLNYTQLGVGRDPVLTVLPSFTITLSAIAWLRRIKLTNQEKFKVPFEDLFRLKSSFTHQRLKDKFLCVILIASIISSLAAVLCLMRPNVGEKFTEFYILGASGKASDYPTNLEIGDVGELIIGIANHEYGNMTYRLEVSLNGNIIHEEYLFLIHNETWLTSFSFQATDSGEDQKLEFCLYKGQEKEAYRTLYLYVDVEKPLHEIYPLLLLCEPSGEISGRFLGLAQSLL